MATADAQSGTAVEGALELLLPTGARALGMGQATAGNVVAAEAMWWNPAFIARAPRQGAIHYAQTIATADSGGDFALALILPVQHVGAFGITARRIGYGTQEATNRGDPTVIAEFSTSVNIVGGSFASSFGDRFDAGVTYKLLQVLFSCSGICENTPSKSSPTSAFDFGGVYRFRPDTSLVAGIALRNLGIPLQVQDAPQADPLPSRIDIGVSYTPKLSQLPTDAQLSVAADLVNRLEPRLRLGYRAGAELAWKKQLQLRAGYVINGPPLGNSTASLGAGYTANRLQVDFAALISVTESGSSPPIFLSARYRF
jgi:hypothetical protein